MVLRSSLWDRLTSGTDESNQSTGVDLFYLKHAVAMDLERLLNTRQALGDSVLSAFPNVRNSVANFGIADFAARSLSSSSDRNEICRSISLAIERFDPRLSDVVVQIRSTKSELHKITFDISAVMMVAELSEFVNFGMLFDSAGMSYRLSE